MHVECAKCEHGVIWFNNEKLCDKNPNTNGSFKRPKNDKNKCTNYKERLKKCSLT